MITSLFAPERIGSYVLIPQRIVGIEITNDALYATITRLKGSTRTIEAIFKEPLELNAELSRGDTIVQSLRALSLKLGKYDKIYFSLPTSQVLFKDLTLPFISRKKVKLVVPFEIESHLPFNLEDGVVDSIVTNENTEEQQTDILVAAIKNDVISDYTRYFEEAELPLNKISVDIFELYSLISSVQDYKKGATALIEMGRSETTLGFIVDGSLKYVRSFKKELSGSSEEFQLNGDTRHAISSVLDAIRITIESSLQKFTPGKPLSQIILTGSLTDIQDRKALTELIKHTLESSVKVITPHDLRTKKLVLSPLDTLSGSYMSTIALSLAPEKTLDFNLLHAQKEAEENQRISYQLGTIGLLVVSVFLTFGLYSFLRIRTLKKTYTASEQEAIKELKKHFKFRATQTSSLQMANKAAQAELKKQETAWRRISPENRYSYLKYLAGLTKCINMQDSRLQLDSIILKDDTIKLYGKVPGYQQLTKLQDQLECPLFKKVPKLQAFNFKTEPIVLTVNPEAL